MSTREDNDHKGYAAQEKNPGWQDFFAFYGKVVVLNYGWGTPITVEELYQMFKARMLYEMGQADRDKLIRKLVKGLEELADAARDNEEPWDTEAYTNARTLIARVKEHK